MGPPHISSRQVSHADTHGGDARKNSHIIHRGWPEPLSPLSLVSRTGTTTHREGRKKKAGRVAMRRRQATVLHRRLAHCLASFFHSETATARGRRRARGPSTPLGGAHKTCNNKKNQPTGTLRFVRFTTLTGNKLQIAVVLSHDAKLSTLKRPGCGDYKSPLEVVWIACIVLDLGKQS